MSGVRLGLGRGMAAVVAISALLAIAFASSASAATEIGSGCQANGLSSIPGSQFVVQTSRSGAPVATVAPGVVTGWKVISGGQQPVTEKLKVVKLVSTGFEGIGESAVEAITPNQTNAFATRIPVPAGARFGAFGTKGVPYCFNPSGSESDVITTAAEDVPVGGIKPAGSESKKIQLALVVTVEPDADGDGFGDETQDGCPQSATSQGACPVAVTPPTVPPTGGGTGDLKLGLKAQLEGDTVAVKVTGNAKASVAVSDKFHGKSVAGPKNTSVEPGQVGRAFLPLSKSFKEQLAKLPRKQHLTLVIEASGKATTGAADKASLELFVPGRKKPHRHHHHRHHG